jgi:Bacterial Ig-like domain (group 2)
VTRWRLHLARLTVAALVTLAGHGCAPTEVSSTPPTGPVESITLSPSADTLLVGDSQQLIAVAKDGKGRPLAGREVIWTSLSPETAAISPAGVVSGLVAGTAQIVATSEGKSAKAVLTVWATRKDTGECDDPKPGWIWCDDFEKDRLASYFEYAAMDGSFVRLPGVGYGGSAGMRARFSRKGQVNAGSLKIAIGKTPSPYFRPVDAGTARYREIYWRHLVKLQAGWIGAGGNKLSRAQVLVDSNWSQAMMAHVWTGVMGDGEPYRLGIAPASGTDASGTVRTIEYNDFAHFRWLGVAWSRTPIFDQMHVGKWYCVEAHARLNDPGRANGIFELWISGGLEARFEGLNWQGAYSDYGINTVFLENYWNDGTPQPQERYFDNFIVSTQRIGC